MKASDSAAVLHNLKQPSQAEIDAGLEREIATAYLAAINAADPDLARAGFKAMGELIERRSQDQIDRMEAKIEGLR